jgi:hypothetical protein
LLVATDFAGDDDNENEFKTPADSSPATINPSHNPPPLVLEAFFDAQDEHGILRDCQIFFKTHHHIELKQPLTLKTSDNLSFSNQ